MNQKYISWFQYSAPRLWNYYPIHMKNFKETCTIKVPIFSVSLYGEIVSNFWTDVCMLISGHFLRFSLKNLFFNLLMKMTMMKMRNLILAHQEQTSLSLPASQWNHCHPFRYHLPLHRVCSAPVGNYYNLLIIHRQCICW